jgi:pyruvate dehydrogenase E1 component
MREMLVDQRDVFYYVTLMNENYAQPDLPIAAHTGVLKGAYRLACLGPESGEPVTLMGSGAIFTEVQCAAEVLAAEGRRVHLCSVTSWSELARDAQAAHAEGRTPWLHTLLADTAGPVIAASDYVRAVPEALRAWLPADRAYRCLGTDGFGRSDTRAALRGYFGVDAAHIAAEARR